MKPPTDAALARQHSGGPSSVPDRGGNRTNRPGGAGTAGEPANCRTGGSVDARIAACLAALTSHRTASGLSRDLLIRALANQLQEWIHGRASGVPRRRQTLAGEFDRNGAAFDPGVVLKTGTTLVRQWRGHALVVLAREDGFEYEGQRYRSLTMIAERITGAHWSGPRFFGLTKRAGGAEADQ